ncbi:transposase [Halorhodospira halochloris]|uniref:IS66 family insertion sequence element accessory protein TnpA n=1 Tax=Halorhodospira halochloris TaxID=1052 RepID=UPI001EE78AFA|nr:transposase [Halorhodospira halochloris]MCG5531718.1 transposase [Halorhodospira halochloris]
MTTTRKTTVLLSEGEWQALLEKQEASDLTIKDFCAQHGVSRSAFFSWRRKLRRNKQSDDCAASSESSPQSTSNQNLFAQIEIPEQLTQTQTEKPACQSNNWDIELELGDGVCLRIRKEVR